MMQFIQQDMSSLPPVYASVETQDLPSLDHLNYRDFDHIYEPSEDTYLFADVLHKENEFLKSIRPTIVLEIGPGSGAIISTIGSIVGDGQTLFLGCDINSIACKVTQKTCIENNITPTECITTDLLCDEVGSNGISAAWAGGLNGREVIDRLLPIIPTLLTDKGVFYMVVIEENLPEDIAAIMLKLHFTTTRLATRRERNELLSILKFTRLK